MNPQEIIAITLGVAISALLVLSGVSIHRTRILGLGIFISTIAIAQYLLLGAPTALAAATVGVVRSAVLYYTYKTDTLLWLRGVWVTLLFVGFHTAAFSLAVDWNNLNLIAILPWIASIIGTVSYVLPRMVMVKASLLIAGGLWLVIQFNTGAYGQMVGESLLFSANIYAIAVIVRNMRAGIPDEEAVEPITEAIKTITTSIETLTGVITLPQPQDSTSP